MAASKALIEKIEKELESRLDKAEGMAEFSTKELVTVYCRLVDGTSKVRRPEPEKAPTTGRKEPASPEK